MTLKVIGSGLGRTGTMSLKLALEQLGLGPCHHMVEMFKRPQTAPLWVAAYEGRPDWDAIFDGYVSMTDYPGVRFWRELIERYPDAKVVHTMRDPDAWFESTQATIFAPGTPATSPPPPLARFFEAMVSDISEGMNDRAYMIDYFNRHNAEVLATIPRQRLLVYEVSQGWGPLCDFLGVPAPDGPFPRENTREAFASRGRDEHGMPDLSELERRR
jgi:hypothetical protein